MGLHTISDLMNFEEQESGIFVCSVLNSLRWKFESSLH